MRLAKEDPPDAEVLTVDPKTGVLDTIKVEVTRYGRHSRSLFDVIGKKLRKRYHNGTALVVLVEQSEKFSAAELHAFIRRNNPHNQQVFVIGAGAEAESFKVVSCNGISFPTTSGTAWIETLVDEKSARKGHRAYVGVSFEPRGGGRLCRAFPQYPIYVKKVTLSR